MYLIKAIHVRFAVTFTLDLDTATLDDLANVKDPGKLPQADKLRYFARQSQLQKEGRVAIVRHHHQRLKKILHMLAERAIGPDEDTVHQELKTSAATLSAILVNWKVKAEAGDKLFSELNLVKAIQPELQKLKGKLVNSDLDSKATAKHLEALEKARRQVGDALARGEAGVRAWIRDSCIKYRGSLATGWRNAQKSQDGTAMRIRVPESGMDEEQRESMKFDSDAFVEVPATTWESWADMEIVTEREREGKMDLAELVVRVKALMKPVQYQLALQKEYLDVENRWGQPKSSRRSLIEIRINNAQVSLDQLDRPYRQLLGVQAVEEQLRLAMSTVAGYKRTSKGEADFSFVLQSSKKSARELTAGNLYPLNEIAKAGLPLTESDLDLVFADRQLMVKMPEKHVSMSQPVATTTYDWETPMDPHTRSRPTEAMLIAEYLGADPQTTLAQFAAAGKQARLGAVKVVDQALTF
ncbi:hypothetical protein [Variovorax sp. V15]|uniref:hypothetical protein n=1 Tax=Variovorax sp. V15 TaxID=3065952 RepID=UPI0034E8BE07